MRFRRVLISLAVTSIMCCTAAAWADTAEAAREFDHGKTLLAQGDFAGALEAFKATAKADAENKDYFQAYRLLRRVIQVRKQFAEEQDEVIWQQTGRALYNYYRQYDILGETLPLARALHEKMASDESAVMLADAQLALDQDAAAADLLAGLSAEQRTVHTDILQGIALARLDRLDEAQALVAELKLPRECDAQVYFDAARLYAQLDDARQALALLQRAFESTPAQFLDDSKADARKCADLAGLATGPEFVRVLETKSEVKAGGGGCGGKSAGGCGSKSAAGCGSKSAAGCGSKSAAGCGSKSAAGCGSKSAAGCGGKSGNAGDQGKSPCPSGNKPEAGGAGNAGTKGADEKNTSQQEEKPKPPANIG